MKIGILTYHAEYNFGANLQAYTTALYLQSLGHEAKIIDYGREATIPKYQKIVPKEQWSAHDSFVENRLPLTQAVNTKDELITVVRREKFDGIIVGADAVWSYGETEKQMPVYFLDWFFETPDIANIPTAAMSVANMSLGFAHLNEVDKAKLKNVISNFSCLTVRDNWTRTAVNEHIFAGENCVELLNPDPVVVLKDLLEDKLDTLGLVEANDKYILFTFPVGAKAPEKWFNKFKAYANARGYKVGELPLPEGASGFDFDFVIPYPIDPIQWYLWLMHSSGFIGMRFHPVVSCISAGVPFISIDSYGSSSSFVKVLSLLGFYRISRLFDGKSKIFQLLHNTKFEKNRFPGVRGLIASKPSDAFEMLVNTQREDITLLCDSLKKEYTQNMKNILDVFKASAPETLDTTRNRE